MPSTDTSTDITLSSVHLDAIRGAAALVVFFGHTRDLYFPSFLQLKNDTARIALNSNIAKQSDASIDQKITFGNESVMIFFVLSGYLVGGSVIKAFKRNTWSWKTYLIKRMTRLWVVLIPALLMGVAIDLLGMKLFPDHGSIYTAPPQQAIVHNLDGHLSLPVLVGNVVFLQGIWVQPAGTNDSLWSLANEFWYYIAFPLSLLALGGNNRAILRGVYLILLFAIGFLVGKTVSLLFFIWLLGALLSIVPLMIRPKIANFLYITIIPALLAAFIMVRSANMPIYLAQWIVALVFAAGIYILLHQTRIAKDSVYRSIAGFFSRMSYTLYLVHLPIAVLLCACINTPWHRWRTSGKSLALYLAMNAGIVLFSYLFYLVFEANTDNIRVKIAHRLPKEKILPTSLAG